MLLLWQLEGCAEQAIMALACVFKAWGVTTPSLKLALHCNLHVHNESNWIVRPKVRNVIRD